MFQTQIDASAPTVRPANEDTGLNVGPDNVTRDVEVDSDELPLQETRCIYYVKKKQPMCNSKGCSVLHVGITVCMHAFAAVITLSFPPFGHSCIFT